MKSHILINWVVAGINNEKLGYLRKHVEKAKKLF